MALPVPEVWTVYGKAYLPDGSSFSQGKIKAFDVSLESASEAGGAYTSGQLGETGFSHDGSYTITYSRWNFQKGDETKTHPILQIRIFDYQDRLLWQSPTMAAPNTNQLVDAHLNGSDPVNDTWVVHGFVRNYDGSPVTLGTVFAYDNADKSYDLGQSTLNSSGYYSITYNKAAFQRGNPNRQAPNLMVRLKNADGLDIAVREENLPSAYQTIDITLPEDSSGTDDDYSVFGRVLNQKGLPIEGKFIQAYAMSFTTESSFTEIPLGHATTDSKGKYTISYNPNIIAGFAKAAIYAEILYKELEEGGSEKSKTITSRLVYGAERHQRFDFTFDEASKGDVTEFAEMNAAFNKYLTAILAEEPVSDTKQKKLTSFLEHPTRLQLAADTESKDSQHADCYFRAFLIAYELQERFDVAKNNQTEPYPADKYAALNYVEFFYALLRTGIITGSADLLKQDPTQLLGHLLGAVSEKIIATDSDVKGFIDLWYEMFQTQSGDEPSKSEWTIYHILLLTLNGSLSIYTLDAATKKLIAKLLGMYYDAGADARRFLEAICPPEPIKDINAPLTEEQWERIEFVLDLGDFGENYRDMVQASFLYCENRDPKITTLKEMLALSEENWKNIVSNASSIYVSKTPGAVSGTLPPEFTGANGAEQQAIYARQLYKKLLTWFPQVEIAVSIRDELAALPNPPSKKDLDEWKAVGEFLSNENYPTYSLSDTNLSIYLQDNPDIVLAEGAQQKIRWLQRLYRLTEHLPSIVYLISKEIVSAYQIAQMGEDHFLADFSVGLGGMNKARHIHRLAVNYTMSASFQISQYNTSLVMQGDSAPAIERGLTPLGLSAPAVAATNLALPRVSTQVVANWKTLFGTLNQNAATRGQSILSPSAYLVDLLEFLKEGEGYRLLIKRRPDILNLKLSQQNAEVALPMIDLAIELLEVLAAPASLSSLNFQTEGNSEDLRAQPEHADQNSQSATRLINGFYPFTLPVNFSREDARLILEKLNLLWRDLALAFPKEESGGYQRRYLAIDAILDKVLQPMGAAAPLPVWDLWGLLQNGNTLYRPDKVTLESNKSWNQILSVMAIFLDRSGLTLDGLQDLLATSTFKNCGVEIYASAEAAQLGDINGYKLTNVNEDFARRMSRFIRLQRLLGWSVEEMDAAWELDLDNLDRVQDLSKNLKIPVLNVIFWRLAMTNAMFAQVFQPLTKDVAVLDAYNKMAKNADSSADVEIGVFATWIGGRLSISRADLDLLIGKVGVAQVSQGEEIIVSVTRAQVEQIYRLSSLAKAVKLSVSDFLKISAWLELPDAANWSLSDCQQFYEKVLEMQTNPLSFANIKQLIFTPDAALIKKGTTFLQQLAAALTTIREQYNVLEVSETSEPEDLEAAVIACLTVLEAGGTEEVLLIQSTKDDTTEILPEEAKGELKTWLLSLASQEIITATDEEIDALLATETIAGRLYGLYSLLLPTVQNRLQTALESEIFTRLTAHFSATMEVMQSLLLDNAVAEPTIPARLHSVNDSSAAAWADWSAVTDADETSLAAYARLAKAAILVSALKLRTAEQLNDWMPNNAAGAPLPDWNEFSIRESDSLMPWDTFNPLLLVLKVLKNLGFQNEGYEALVSDNGLRLEKWDLRESDLEILLEEAGLNGSTDADPVKWMRFSRLLALFRNAFTLPDILKAILSPIPIRGSGTEANPYVKADDVLAYMNAVANLRRNVMGSMVAASWREFIQPVNDGLRSRKRDALAAYVCWKSQQPGSASAFYPCVFFDTNDLYNYYLTDVEMEPDMQTSRIRQALNSVQQFVQRALLGLEGLFTLTEEQKGYWEWMRNYRVWEANRKVFLYAENWIEPELRDDKTPFFKELENKLTENSSDPNAMENALAEYLEKMRDVGGLEIVGACKEDGNGSAHYILHVIGRTHEEPGVFYHRRYLAKALHSGEWTPWEKIDAEIQAVSVAVVIMNGNLFLTWPDIQHKEEEAEPYEGETALGADNPKSILELRLNWTYYNGKKWSGKKTTKSVLSHVVYDRYGHKLGTGESYEDRFHFQTINNSSDFIQVKVYRSWYDYDILKPKKLTIKVNESKENNSTIKEIDSYSPSEYQMIEAFGEFQIWKNGRDESTYYGGTWDRENLANYTNYYPHANSNLVHNFWMESGLLEDYEEQTYDSNILEKEPQPPQKKKHESKKKFKKRWEKWEQQYLEWRGVVKETETAEARKRAAGLVDPSEVGKLIFPKGNVILNKIDGGFSLYPVNFSFYTGKKLPFFFMDEERTYLIEEVARDKGANTNSYGHTAYRFNLMTHTLVDEFHKRYKSGGREWLFTRETEALPMAEGYYRSYSYYNYYFSVYLGYYIAGDWEAWDLSQSLFEYRYQPQSNAVTRPFPNPVVDFSWGSSNGIYNWELFFHVPMMIASKLTQEQRYEDAMDWMHMVFDPRIDLTTYERTKRWAQALPKGSRFWRFLPFFANKDADATILETLGVPSARDKTPERDALEALIDRWKSDPFNPHMIARARPAAYQKYVVMKYMDNLIAWADQLFTTDTMESINEAIQLYILAADILGPKSAETAGANFEDALDVSTVLKSKQEALGNIMIKVEDDLVKVNNREKTVPQLKLSAEAGQLVHLSGSMFYFGVPRNEKLQSYWETVADRLYKIRNSLNIEGIKRVLALYEPPIDPALLVRARAMGLDISSVLSSLNAPLPLYRFRIMVQKAMDVVRDVQSLGGALLSVLEKKDGEALSLLRVEQEREMLTLNKTIRKLQIDEANAHLDSLQKNRESAEERYTFYKEIEKYSTSEVLAMTLTGTADGLQILAGLNKTASSISVLAPDSIAGGVANAFGGPFFGLISGGTKISMATSGGADALQIMSQVSRSGANLAQTLGGYERRWADWKLQQKLAKMDMDSLDKQILAAEIRINMAEKEMENLEHQIEQSDEIYEFMNNRFTNQELYKWMATELGRLYSNTFQQALTVAQRAERCYQFELGIENESTSFIQTGYWDGLRQGLLAGERLLADLRRMDLAFLEKNKRELEITRPVSLAQLNPVALRKLQEEGACAFEVPEVLFDMDFPGQYFRRIKSVRLEIPCNAGSYASISAKLSLTSNRLRVSDTIQGDAYNHLDNYLDNRIGIQSIATSQAQNDGGLFELNFQDERYLPFEGAGAISTWRLELPAQFRQFDYQSIADAVLYISYTARDSGGLLKETAINNIATLWNAYQILSEDGLRQEIRLGRDYYDSLQELRSGLPVNLQIGPRDFPMFTDGLVSVQSIRILAKSRNEDVSDFNLKLELTGDISGEINAAFTQNQWTEIWRSEDGLSADVNGEWLLDASANSQDILNNLGDIMIEYRYHLNGEG